MISINGKGPIPIYEQIIAQIKEHVFQGRLKPGDPIPSIRKLALAVQVNPNTVSKAYNELERQSIIETIRGKGTFIAESAGDCANYEQINQLKTSLNALILEMLGSGITQKDLINLVTEICFKFNNAKKGTR